MFEFFKSKFFQWNKSVYMSEKITAIYAVSSFGR